MSQFDEDLETARNIIRAGIPVILWKAGRSTPPTGWPQAKPDLSVIDQFKPGDKLYVVTGQQAEGGVDVADLDPRNGAEAAVKALKDEGKWPSNCGLVSTPSGGMHVWLPPVGVHKGHPGAGIDYQAGKITAEGEHVGRGLAAIPPTIGSKTSPSGRYTWKSTPNFSDLAKKPSEPQLKMTANMTRSDPPRGCELMPKKVLAETARAIAHEYEEKYITTKLKAMVDIKDKPSKVGLWDETVYKTARDLIKLANAYWSESTYENLWPRYNKACEMLADDGDWAERMQNKWDRAIIEVTDATSPPAELLQEISNMMPPTLSDDGNALLFVDLNVSDIRYVPQALTQWHVWNGFMWMPDVGNKHIEMVRKTLRRLPGGDSELEKHRKHSLNKGGLMACASLASSDERIVKNQDEFDCDPLKLNTPGGVVNLLLAELEKPSKDEYHSKVTKVAPNFEAECPKFMKFLEQTFAGPDRDELIDFIQQVFGYTVSGSVDFDFMPFLFGSGQNGKTVLAAVLCRIMGDYAAYAPSGLLTKAEYSHETTKAFLFGKRFVIVPEENEGANFNEARVKEYSGGEPLTARFMNRNDFTWTPTQKIWIVANDKPNVRSGGDAFWRRVKLINFPNKVRDEDKIVGLEDILVEEEGPAILAWACRGAARVFRDGLQIPKAIELATQDYAAEEDHVQRFLNERCRLGNADPAKDGLLRSMKSDIRHEYNRWAMNEGVNDIKDAKALGNALAKKGIIAGGSGKKYYYGVELINNETETITFTSPHQRLSKPAEAFDYLLNDN